MTAVALAVVPGGNGRLVPANRAAHLLLYADFIHSRDSIDRKVGVLLGC